MSSSISDDPSTSLTLESRRHSHLGAISSPLPTMAVKDLEIADEYLRRLKSGKPLALFLDGESSVCSKGEVKCSGRPPPSTRHKGRSTLTLDVETINDRITHARKMGLLNPKPGSDATHDVHLNSRIPRTDTSRSVTPNLATPISSLDVSLWMPVDSKIVRFLWGWIPLGSYRLTFYPAGKPTTPVVLSPDGWQQCEGAGGGGASASNGLMTSSVFSKNSGGNRQSSRSVWSRHASRLILAVSESYPSFGIDRLSTSGVPAEFYRDDTVKFILRRRPLSLSPQTVLGVPLISAVWAFMATMVWPQIVSVPRAFSVRESVLGIWLTLLFIWLALCLFHIFLLRPWQIVCSSGRRIVMEARWKSSARRVMQMLNDPPAVPEPGKPPLCSPLPRDDLRQVQSLAPTIIVTFIFICLMVGCIMTLVM
ncbi:hypothetical protein FOL47_007967 [Perkinsus chesapeaki]|uniref:Uncharacterized protein n=1 Tax=Perkinsus chesapeaki TaxID=330153 RepID=A0A7J6LHZ1_PERCH|nr:hypothetical protein FOL47_007967 [Perkinsus chesapeaki]